MIYFLFFFFFLFPSIELFYFRYFAKLNYPFCESEQSYYDDVMITRCN